MGTDNTRATDVLRLVDQLDDLIHQARPVPPTSQVRIERAAAYKLLDELRLAVSELAKQGEPGF